MSASRASSTATTTLQHLCRCSNRPATISRARISCVKQRTCANSRSGTDEISEVGDPKALSARKSHSGCVKSHYYSSDLGGCLVLPPETLRIEDTPRDVGALP